VKAMRASYSGWSHRHLVCLLKADITPKALSSKIEVDDNNFPAAPGSYRIALKGRSGVSLKNATVPPIISGAKPVDPSTLSKTQRRAASRAEAEVILQATQKESKATGR
ncbi:MAG: hypothetical protein AAFP69_20800, partial [Planctomycetota bacterium]